MKYKAITLLSLLTLAIIVSGCSSTNISNLVAAAGTNNATVVGSVTSIYGTVKITRLNPPAGSTATVSPDGTVNVSVPKASITSTNQ